MAYAVQGVARLIQPIFWHVAKPKDLIGQVANIALLGYVAFKVLGILAKKYHFTLLNTAEDKARLVEEKRIDDLINSGKNDLRIDQTSHPFFQAKEELKKMNRDDLWIKLVMNFIFLNPTFLQIQTLINEAPKKIQLKLYEDAAFLMYQLKHEDRDIRACCQVLIEEILEKNQALSIESQPAIHIAEAKRLTNDVLPRSNEHHKVLELELERLQKMKKICPASDLSRKENELKRYLDELKQYIKQPSEDRKKVLEQLSYNQYGIDHQFTDSLIQAAETLTNVIEDPVDQINHYIDIYYGYNWDCESQKNSVLIKIKQLFDSNLGSEYKVLNYLSSISMEKLNLIEKLIPLIKDLNPIFYWDFSKALDRLTNAQDNKFKESNLNEKLVYILCHLQEITKAQYMISWKVVKRFLEFFKKDQNTSLETLYKLLSTTIKSFENVFSKHVESYRTEIKELKKKINIPSQQAEKGADIRSNAVLLQGIVAPTLWGLTHLYRALR